MLEHAYRGHTKEVQADMRGPCETYCYACKQLRLWLKPEEPSACGNCKSSNIEVDKLGSEKLTRLREAKEGNDVINESEAL